MSPALEPGQPAPDFTLPSTAGPVHLADLTARGKVVLAFYAEDATPLCATEIRSFKDEYETLTELGAQVVGISADGLDAHHQFAESLGGLPFPLASDTSLDVARQYGVVDDTQKRSLRAVFVIGEDGAVLHANGFYNPGNPGQYAEVFQALGLEL
ncbi:MAG: peroxiredoxin [Chloroflexi bacterium]|nr:peroxiredoxin [Chloroflexota bacterium]MCI0769784.1 peroxiredoxin [Chloroflexota bacterium]